MSAREQAQGRWRSVLTQLGIPANVLDGKHHACPATGQGEDRFRFADRNGSGNYFCGCSDGRKGGMPLLMCCRGLTYAEAAKEVESVIGKAEPDPQFQKADPRIALNRVQKLLRPIGAEVTGYLRSRGLSPAPGLRQARLAYWHDGAKLGVYEAMVGKIVSPQGKPESFHITYLQGDRKADVPVQRKVMTPVNGITGGAIRLYPPGPTLGVAEGIETAIAAHMLAGVPVWAAVSAHGIETFDPPATTERLLIFGDADDSFTGQAAAYLLGKRMKKRGLACEVRLPAAGDWNDAIKREAA